MQPPATRTQHMVAAMPAHLQGQVQQTRTSFWTYVTVILGFVYMLSPIDVLPDVIPLLGWLDDLLVLMYMVYMMMPRPE